MFSGSFDFNFDFLPAFQQKSKEDLLAVKYLHIKKSSLISRSSNFQLKKKVLQIILKKKCCQQISSKLISWKEFQAIGATLGNRVYEIELKKIISQSGLQKDTIPLNDEIHLKKIISNSKGIKTFSVSHFMELTLPLVKSIILSRNLSSLSFHLNPLFF